MQLNTVKVNNQHVPGVGKIIEQTNVLSQTMQLNVATAKVII